MEICVDQRLSEAVHVLIRRAASLHVEQLRQTSEKHAARMRGVVRAKGTFLDSALENRRENLQEARTGIPSYFGVVIHPRHKFDESLVLDGMFQSRAENPLQFLPRGQVRAGSFLNRLQTRFDQAGIAEMQQVVFVLEVVV